MNMNPMALLAMKAAFDRFKNNHPRFVQFVQVIAQNGIKEGTVFDCKVTLPDGRELQTNFKVTQDDLELFEKLKELSKNK